MSKPPAAKPTSPVQPHRGRRILPFYAQALDFTCGPACLLMAMAAQDARVDLSMAHEIDVWREATTAIPPGSSRYGLALAAHRRGFRVRLLANGPAGIAPPGIDLEVPGYYTRDDLDQLLQDREARVRAAGIREDGGDVRVVDVEQALDAGEIPIALTSTAHFGEPEGIPHWIVVVAREPEGEDGAFAVGNPLDPARTYRTMTRDQLASVLGWSGYHEAVIIGSRFGAY